MCTPQNDGFSRLACVRNLLSEDELTHALPELEGRYAPGTLAGKLQHGGYRTSQVTWVKRNSDSAWLYERIWSAVETLNNEIFHFDITGFQTSLQIARYSAEQQGFYTWHMDNGPKNPTRKLTLSLQLTGPDEYDGGDLELFFAANVRTADRAKGALVAFPSFVMHQVAPVTRGTRKSLVAWVEGPRWK